MTNMDTPWLQILLKHLSSQKLKLLNVFFYERQTTVCFNQGEEEEEKEESLFHHVTQCTT